MTAQQKKQLLNRLEQEKIALFHAGKTKTQDYVWLIDKERALKRRERPKTAKTNRHK